MSPFGYGRGEGVDAGHGDPEWICSKEKPRYDQIFQSLNPIDGKVTGAGTLNTQQIAHILRTRPHLRGTVFLDRTLQALLSSTHNCSQLTELCMTLKQRKDAAENDTVTEFDKIANALTVSTQNCSMIVQLLMSDFLGEANVPRMSSAVSIHSLDESLAPDGAVDEALTRSESKNESDLTDNDRESYDVPFLNLEADIKPESNSFFTPIRLCLKFIILLILNVIAITITAQILFQSLVYVFTGKLYISFTVETTPQTWLDTATAMAFGSSGQTVRIDTIFELFHRDNVVKIIKYVVQYMRHNYP